MFVFHPLNNHVIQPPKGKEGHVQEKTNTTNSSLFSCLISFQKNVLFLPHLFVLAEWFSITNIYFFLFFLFVCFVLFFTTAITIKGLL